MKRSQELHMMRRQALSQIRKGKLTALAGRLLLLQVEHEEAENLASGKTWATTRSPSAEPQATSESKPWKESASAVSQLIDTVKSEFVTQGVDVQATADVGPPRRYYVDARNAIGSENVKKLRDAGLRIMAAVDLERLEKACREFAKSGSPEPCPESV